MNLSNVRDSVHNRYLKLRALDRIVSSQRFAMAYRLCNPDDAEIEKMIEAGNAEGVEEWINNLLERELDDLSMRELRNRACTLKIPYYTIYKKDALILKILEVQEDARKAQQTPVNVPLSEANRDSESARHDERAILNLASQ